jgi:hypothetical protein
VNSGRVSTADVPLAGDFSVGSATAGVFFFVILSLFGQLVHNAENARPARETSQLFRNQPVVSESIISGL